MEIFVQRGQGESRGPDVVNPLLATLNALKARGQAELDEASDIKTVRLQTVFRTGVKPGQMILVIDQLQGEQWVGKIDGIRHVAGGGTLLTELDVLRRQT